MRALRAMGYSTAAVVLVVVGFGLGRSDLGRQVTRAAHHAAVDVVVERGDLGMRQRVLFEHPEIIGAVRRGGAFGGEKATGGGREAGSDAWKSYMRRRSRRRSVRC